MKIITYKNNLITYEDFLKNNINDTLIDGMIIPIIMTKDKEIIVFDDQITCVSKTEILKNNTYKELENACIIKLEDFLNKIKYFKKRIILNIYPLYQVILSDDAIKYINEINNQYIKEINNIIKIFPNLNISLCTYNQLLIQKIKNIITNRKKGLIVKEDNLNYIDVDFYIIPPTMLDVMIINEELSRGKEVMISSYSSSDMAIINEYFILNSTQLKNKVLNQLTFVSAFPDLFKKIFNINN